LKGNQHQLVLFTWKIMFGVHKESRYICINI